MTEASLFPRLSGPGVRVILEDETLFSASWKDRETRVQKWVSRAATGGLRVSDEQLSALRERVLALATANGFPTAKQPKKETAAFDIQLTKALIDEDLVPRPEAMRDDVWAFLAAVLLPDVVRWRYGGTLERYRGGVRNTFQRLWLRGVAFRRGAGDDRWEIVESLNEDANVQILERPSLAGTPAVARAIGEEWLTLYRRPLGGALEEVTRRVAVTLRITNKVLYLASLDDGALRAEVASHFKSAVGD